VPGEGDWYLRSQSTAVDSADPPAPLFQPGATLYEGYANVLHSFSEVRTMQ
jgi:hypothetical protein